MITILCAGTRGDVQPYLALALALQELGLPVRLAATRDFAPLVRSCGVEFFSIEVDYASLGVDMDMVRQAQQADNPLKMFLSFQKMKRYGEHMVALYAAACQGSQLILYHPGLAVGYYAAAELGVPCVLASPFPLHTTRQRPSLIVYGKLPSLPALNALSHALLQGMLWSASEASLKPFLKQRSGRLPADFGAPFERHANPRCPAIISCSNHVFPRPRDWNPHIHQHGYWFLDEPSTYTPPAALAQFLANGEPPVYVGFGSMAHPEVLERVLQAALEGLRLAGQRAVLGGVGQRPGLPASVFPVESLPHDWLFPRMSAVCHHGGAGTSAAGFRAGLPSLIFPFALDQYAWAQRACELGVSPRPTPARALTPARFAAALRFARQPGVVAQARALGARLAEEDGARACARVVARCLES